MARARNIKPALFKNEILGVADPIYTLLFSGLWLLADRDGRLEDRPLRVKAELFPYREGIDMSSMLGWLVEAGFIYRYSVGENRYIEIVNFAKHQNPHKNEASSEIPSFSMGCTSSDKIGTSTDKLSIARADSLSLDSLSLDSLPTASPDAEQFDRFWKLYPNKKAKASAEKSWAKLKPDQSLVASIMGGLAKQVASAEWKKDGGAFIPHPATWLNAKRWQDEVKESNRTGIHHGFDELDYTKGLVMREDGSYAL